MCIRDRAKCAQCNGIGLSTTTGDTLKKLLEENKLEADKLNEKLTEVQKLSTQTVSYTHLSKPKYPRSVVSVS